MRIHRLGIRRGSAVRQEPWTALPGASGRPDAFGHDDRNTIGRSIENEGPPGYVDENTENEEMVEVTDCPEVMAASAEQTASEVAKAKSEPPSPESEAGSAESELQSAESGAQKARSAAGNQVIEAGNEVSEVESARSKLRNEGPPQVRQAAA